MPDERALLFQFGSNMSRARLQQRIDDYAEEFAPPGTPTEVEFVGPARLPGWRFAVDIYSWRQDCLACNVVPDEDHEEVWGALYRLSKELVVRSDGGPSVMDHIECHRTAEAPQNYRPMTVAVELHEEPLQAITYVGLDEARRRCVTDHGDAQLRPHYVEFVIGGAKASSLPGNYIAFLEEVFRG